jgi:PAS domain S-box-containing protein
MKWLNDLPLRRKLTLIILLACSAALILACGVLAGYQMFDFRRTLVRDTTVLADVIGETSGSALEYNDEDSAHEMLLALQAEPDVVAAALFRPNGTELADYARAGGKSDVPAKPGKDGRAFANGRLEVFRPVRLNNKRVGTLFMELDAHGVNDRLRLLAGVCVVVLLGSFMVALGLAAPLQRSVSRPIMALAETARQIAERKDYTARANVQDRHEIGALTKAFNDMLAQIQQQNAALTENEERFRLMVASIGDHAIFGLDKEGRISTWNPGAEHILGYKASEVMGKFASTFHTAEDIADGKLAKGIASATASGSFRDEGWRVRKGDARIWATITMTAIRDESGELRGFVNVMRDITARRNAEIALAYERDLLTTLLDNLPDSIYFKDRASRYVRLSRSKVQKGLAFSIARHQVENPGAPLPVYLSSLEIFGRHLLGKSDEDFFAPEDARFVREEEDAIVNTGKPILGKVEKAALKDGTAAWTLSTKMPWRDTDGNIIGTFGTSQDVTAIKETEQRLQSQLERLGLLDKITRAIGERQDLNSIFQVVIRRLEDQLPIDFGCVCLHDGVESALKVAVVGTRNELVAESIRIIEQGTIEVGENGLAKCLRGHLVYEPDLRNAPLPFAQRLAAGGLCSVVFAPMQVESQVFGVLIAARRAPYAFSSGECEFLKQLSEHVALAAHQSKILTALQQAYDDLRQTQQAVMQQERLRALGQMASGIAHDINNAISPVALYVESLLDNEPNLSTRTRDYLGTIQHAIEDVAQTVARMREFYRQREPQLALGPVKLNDSCRQVLELTRARWNDMAQQRGLVIKVETDLAEDLPPVLGIDSEIREAMVNLVLNAVDAMPDGGSLTLRTAVVGADTKARHVSVEITDTGIGMDEDTRRRCLEPFFTTKGERGTGLGLAMVYGIVRRHGADIEIESTPGKGTTVRMVFAEATAPASPQEPAPSAPLPIRLRILIVDDDPLLIKSLRDILEMDGHIVIAANGGREGIEEFRNSLQRQEKVSVVMTDLGMPYVDGRQVAASVKAASPSTPVILLTGWGLRLIAENDVPPHVDRVLNKPPKLRQLREALAECVAATPTDQSPSNQAPS